MLNEASVTVPASIGQYDIVKTLGCGTFSVVKLAIDRSTNEKLAVKIIPKDLIFDDKKTRTDLYKRFCSEIRIINSIQHSSIALLKNVYKDHSNFYVFMEYCEGGELFQYIVSHKKICEDQAKNFLFQICSAIDYLHSKRICHRDLKPENLLLTENFTKVKIIDFGFSKILDSEISNNLAKTFCGSLYYLPPEIINGEKYDGTKSDMWSIGVVFYAMIIGDLPWRNNGRAQIADQIKKGDFLLPKSCSEFCREIINGLICVNPENRLTARGVLDMLIADQTKPHFIPHPVCRPASTLRISPKSFEDQLNQKKKFEELQQQMSQKRQIEMKENKNIDNEEKPSTEEKEEPKDSLFSAESNGNKNSKNFVLSNETDSKTLNDNQNNNFTDENKKTDVKNPNVYILDQPFKTKNVCSNRIHDIFENRRKSVETFSKAQNERLNIDPRKIEEFLDPHIDSMRKIGISFSCDLPDPPVFQVKQPHFAMGRRRINLSHSKGSNVLCCLGSGPLIFQPTPNGKRPI